METKEQEIKPTEAKYCIWKYFAENYWNRENIHTKKCLECPADKEYCDLYTDKK